MLTKTFPLKDAGFEKVAAGDGTLALINQFALCPLTPEDVYVRRMIVANDQLDRDNERFSAEVLQQFARTLSGKAFLVGHQHGSAPIGRFFHAEVAPASPLPQTTDYGLQATATSTPEARSPQPGARSLNLVASFYTIKTKDNEGFRQQIDGGVYSSVSVGFRCEKLVCDICGKDMKSTLCPHYPGKAYPPNGGLPATGTWKGRAEALEASLVYLGAQFGAQFVKSPASCDSCLEQHPVGADGLVRPGPTRRSAPTEAELVSAPGGSPVIARSEATWQSPAPRQARGGEQGRTAGGGKTTREHIRPPSGGADSPTVAGSSAAAQETASLKTLDSRLKALEALLEAKERRLDQLSELAEEAKILRSDLVSQILSKAHLVGLPSLFDPESLPDLPLSRLKSLLSDLNRQFDSKFPPQGVTTGYGLQATGSGNTHPRSPESGVRTPDLSPFRLPNT